MRRLVQIIQTHIACTVHEVVVVAWLSFLLIVGTIGGMVMPEDAPHVHIASSQLLAYIDSVDRNAQSNVLHHDTTVASPSPPQTKSRQPVPVRINVASRAQLELLPGVGPATADLIIAARTTRKFNSAEDLLDIKGIGKKKLEKMRPYIILP